MDVDTAVAMVLGVLFLAFCLGGLVWLDTGPVGRHGRDVVRSAQEPADDELDDTLDDTFDDTLDDEATPADT